MIPQIRGIVLMWAILSSAAPLFALSFYRLRPQDPHAVYLEPATFDVHGDGVADDSDAIQQAIDRVQETTKEGIVFVPEGRYRLSKTVYLWSGIRLIGYGANRPVFVLGENTPGFQEGAGFEGTGHYMIYFASRRPTGGGPPTDANEFTFFSAISNVDFEIRNGNPAAIAVRFHVAQHSFLAHMDFHVGSARAAVEDVGNQASDLHIEGGAYGIITQVTSPAWQFLLMDSSFQDQRVAAIHTQEAGVTLVRDRFAHVPVALEIAPGRVEQLYGRDLEMIDVRTAALMLGNATNPHSQVNLENVICRDVVRFLENETGSPMRDAASVGLGSRLYVEEHLSVGLEIGDDGRDRGFAIRHRERPLAQAAAVASDITALPAMNAWVNVHTLGVRGDGSDDTAALEAAIGKYPALYLPSGIYRLTHSLRLRRTTVLIGLNPATTQLALADGEAAFQSDPESNRLGPVPILISARGGANIVTGLGVASGAGNPRAVGVLWLSGRGSLLDDVSFRRWRGRPESGLAAAWPGEMPAQNAERVFTSKRTPAAAGRTWRKCSTRVCGSKMGAAECFAAFGRRTPPPAQAFSSRILRPLVWSISSRASTIFGMRFSFATPATGSSMRFRQRRKIRPARRRSPSIWTMPTSSFSPTCFSIACRAM